MKRIFLAASIVFFTQASMADDVVIVNPLDGSNMNCIEATLMAAGWRDTVRFAKSQVEADPGRADYWEEIASIMASSSEQVQAEVDAKCSTYPDDVPTY